MSTRSSLALKCSSLAHMHSSLVPKAFISIARSVCPQQKMCSSLAINMFVCNVIHIGRWVAKTILLLAMNVFICSVKSYSEVSSRNYLVASDIRVRLVFGIWFRNPQKDQKLGERVAKKSWFHVRAGPVKRTKTRQEWENSRAQPYYGMMAPYFLSFNTMHFHPWFTLHTV